MTSMTKVEAAFRLRGKNLDPDEVTQALHITPTVGRISGGVYSEWGRRQPTGVWILESNLGTKYSGKNMLDAHLRSLLDQLEAKSEIVTQLRRRRYKAEFYCVCYMQEESEGTVVDSATIARVAALGASLGISVWIPARLM